MLISRDNLKVVLARMDSVLSTPVKLLLVGGSAVVALCPRAVATKDLDAFPTETLGNLQNALDRARGTMDPIDLNIASAAFETYLPEDWQSRIRRHDSVPYRESFSIRSICCVSWFPGASFSERISATP